MAKPWHTLWKDVVLKKLNVSPEGLSSQEARERLLKYGYNEIKKKLSAEPPFHMFLDEFKDILLLLLIAATIFFQQSSATGRCCTAENLWKPTQTQAP